MTMHYWGTSVAKSLFMVIVDCWDMVWEAGPQDRETKWGPPTLPPQASSEIMNCTQESAQ